MSSFLKGLTLDLNICLCGARYRRSGLYLVGWDAQFGLYSELRILSVKINSDGSLEREEMLWS